LDYFSCLPAKKAAAMFAESSYLSLKKAIAVLVCSAGLMIAERDDGPVSLCTWDFCGY
jgi:hypothetical protein